MSSHTHWSRDQIEADIEHLKFVMHCIEDTLVLNNDDMRLRRALRWAIGRKRRILRRLDDPHLNQEQPLLRKAS